MPGPTDALSRIRLRGGRELAVLNVSTTGALVEGSTRLLPGTHLDVHVTTRRGRVLIRARVVRCEVWAITADVVTYRGALAFAEPVDLPSVGMAASAIDGAATKDQQPVGILRPVAEPASSDDR
jgi:hypothetical protein